MTEQDYAARMRAADDLLLYALDVLTGWTSVPTSDRVAAAQMLIERAHDALNAPAPSEPGLTSGSVDVETLARAMVLHREHSNADALPEACDFHCAEPIAAEYARLRKGNDR